MTEEEQFLAADHPIMVLGKTFTEKFDGGSQREIKVSFFWGVKELNKEGGTYWDSSFIGKGVMDPEFDLSPEDA